MKVTRNVPIVCRECACLALTPVKRKNSYDKRVTKITCTRFNELCVDAVPHCDYRASYHEGEVQYAVYLEERNNQFYSSTG
mgnify:CR=1 FL=1